MIVIVTSQKVLTDVFYLRVCVFRERALSKCITVNKSRLVEGSSVESVVTCRVCPNLPSIAI
jgi:hypothetical protein